jgi:hypothetical protein
MPTLDIVFKYWLRIMKHKVIFLYIYDVKTFLLVERQLADAGVAGSDAKPRVTFILSNFSGMTQ